MSVKARRAASMLSPFMEPLQSTRILVVMPADVTGFVASAALAFFAKAKLGLKLAMTAYWPSTYRSGAARASDGCFRSLITSTKSRSR